MEQNVEYLLEEEITNQFKALDSLDYGSEEHSRAVEDLTKLYKLKLDESKANREFEDRLSNQIKEDEFKKTQLETQKFDIFIRAGLVILEVGGTLLFYNRWMKKGLKFEETGTFTSNTFRGLTKFFKPTKK